MYQCLNPDCLAVNPETHRFCRQCGQKLWLKDRYQALKLIGQGGFGKTFLAIDHDKPSKPPCVIKLFLPSALGTDSIEKAAQLFSQEAERLETLGKHSQIPELLAYFEQEGKLYLVQEYIEGQNLADCLQIDGKWTETEIQQLLVEMLTVLEFVHSNNVIHRDVKPENIIRRPILGGYQYVLVDFGAARYVSGSTVIQTGTIIGDPRYMPDEQIQGKAIFASDLYSLGLTCLTLLTDIDPWSLFDSSEGKWVWRDYLTTTINGTLGEVLEKLVCKPTKYRFQSANEALGQLITNNTSSKTSSSYEIKETSPNSDSELSDEGDKLLDLGKYEEAISLFDLALAIEPNNDNLWFKKGFALGRLGRYEDAISVFDKASAINLNNTYALYYKASSLERLNRYEEAYFTMSKAINLDSNNPNLVHYRGVILYKLNRYENALVDFEQAAKIDSDYYPAYDGLGATLLSLQRYQEAVEACNKVLNLNPENSCAWYNREISSLYLSGKQGRILLYEKDPDNYFQPLTKFEKNGKWGFLTQNKTIWIQPKFDEVYDFSNGLAAVRLQNRWGFINYEGNIIVPLKFDQVAQFWEGLAAVKSGEKFGYINRIGEILIPIQFSCAGPFSEGLAAVKINEKYRFIDKTGKIIIALNLESADHFSEGLAPVCFKGKYGCIDHTGRFIITPKFDWLGNFVEGLAPVKIKDKLGYINSKGTLMIPLQFNEVGYFENGKANVKQYKYGSLILMEGAIDKAGKWITKKVISHSNKGRSY